MKLQVLVDFLYFFIILYIVSTKNVILRRKKMENIITNSLLVINIGLILFTVFVLVPKAIIGLKSMNKLIKLQKSEKTIIGITGIIYKI